MITGSGFSWNAGTNPTWVPMNVPFDTLAAAVRTGAEHYNLLLDYYFDPADLPGISEANITLGLNFVGQTVGTYAGETEVVQGTATIPLESFGLGDVVDQGVTSYSAQLGVTATGDVDPFSFYVDNLRLEQISTPDLLTLQIDRSNGTGTLKNLSTNPISWNYFDIKSAGGSLSPSGWSSLDDQNIDGANTWIKAGGASGNELAEASLSGSHTMMPNESIPLGSLYNNGINAEDLNFVIRRADGPTNRTYDQIVTYVGVAPVGLIGDYNGNHVVDAADYTIWRDNLGAPGSVLGANRDPANGSGVVGPADYTSWKAHLAKQVVPVPGDWPPTTYRSPPQSYSDYLPLWESASVDAPVPIEFVPGATTVRFVGSAAGQGNKLDTGNRCWLFGPAPDVGGIQTCRGERPFPRVSRS